MGYSTLVSYVKISPHKNSPRKYKIVSFAIHVMAGNLSLESCGQLFQTRESSSQYGIDTKGRIACYCDENDRAWTTSSGAVDHRAITIEIANPVAKHPWEITDESYKALINLLVDCCKRHNIPKLVWYKTKEERKAHVTDIGMLHVHRDYANKACPGDYLYNRMGEIAETVNKILNEGDVNHMTIDEFIENLTNEQAAKIVNKGRQHFRNMEASSYAEEALVWAKENGYLVGNETGDQDPRDFLLREQLATVLHRYDQSRNSN